MIESKFRFDAEELGGRIYIFGGQVALSLEEYDVSSTFEVMSFETAGAACGKGGVAGLLVFFATFLFLL